jgi:membrane-bound lytic murein transglycosylase MltF
VSSKKRNVYWLDADAYIQSKDEVNGAFPFKRAPEFWKYLAQQIDLGIVRSPKFVYDEITKGNDDLAEWFREREDKLAIVGDSKVHACAGRISDYVVSKFGDRRAREFLRGGDLWVIAHAMAMGENGIVVSHESLRRQELRVKIPAICMALGVTRITIFAMLNQLGARL